MNPESSPDAAPPEASAAAPVVLRWNRSWSRSSVRRIAIAIAVVVASIPLFVLLGVVTGRGWVPVIGVVVAGLGLALWARRRELRLARFIAEEVGAANDSCRTIENLLTRLINHNVVAGLGVVAATLVRRRELGRTMLIVPDEFVVPARPLEVEFEPLPIDEADENFLQLAALDSDASAAVLAPLASAEASYRARRLRRSWRLGGRWILWIYALPFVMSVWRAYQTRRLQWDVFFWGGMIVLYLIGPDGLAGRGSTGTLLVPGGILWRRAGLFSLNFLLHRFQRVESALCATRISRNHWAWIVADANAQTSGFCTQLELTVLLRAWLSPKPPPPLDRLADLR